MKYKNLQTWKNLSNFLGVQEIFKFLYWTLQKFPYQYIILLRKRRILFGQMNFIYISIFLIICIKFSKLNFPKPNYRLHLYTNASESAIRVYLFQIINDIAYPVNFSCCILNSPDANYSTFGRDMLGIVRSIK